MNQIFSDIPILNIFTFQMCTLISTLDIVHLLSTNDIQQTFIGWKYSPITCYVDYFSDNHLRYHIYSISMKRTHFMYVTNSFRGNHFQFVKNLKSYASYLIEDIYNYFDL